MFKGGVLLSITGSGFSKQSIVTIDGNVCSIQTYTYNLLTCVVPPNVSILSRRIIKLT